MREAKKTLKWPIWKPVRGPHASRFRVHKSVSFWAIYVGPPTVALWTPNRHSRGSVLQKEAFKKKKGPRTDSLWGVRCGPASGCPAYIYIYILLKARFVHISLGNGVRKNGVRNRCPYRRCEVDTEIPYRLPFWREFCWVSRVRVDSLVDPEFPYRGCIVDRGDDLRDPCLLTPFPISQSPEIYWKTFSVLIWDVPDCWKMRFDDKKGVTRTMKTTKSMKAATLGDPLCFKPKYCKFKYSEETTKTTRNGRWTFWKQPLIKPLLSALLT